ncbi:hypothetical protein L3081_25405 [Colwellia sp. MSW7]|uniref:C883-1060-like ketoreductase domain-containing protein n=1 Tax=Colwellia maritima TaxID=2912588 RepID=A0ABS9X7U4_9GAMM|nr:hypothetical protein [Colwellia maritima]MCI2286155.1 hypothetical protein [Colwellia maritima]
MRDYQQMHCHQGKVTKGSHVWLLPGANEKQCEVWKHALTCKGIRMVTVFPAEEYCCYRNDHYSINLTRQADFQQLFSQLSSAGLEPHNVIHLLNQGRFNSRPTSEVYNSFYSVIWLAAAQADNSANPRGFFIVSNNTHMVLGTEQMAAERAMLMACIRVIPQEYPQIYCKNIDIDDSEQDTLKQETFELFYTEINRETDERMIAYRNGMRRKPTYQRMTHSMEQRSLLPKQGGVYLVREDWAALV